MTTLWVQATRTDRKVILSEADAAHPSGELWIVGYPPRETDAGEPIPGNQPIEVGDTPGVRRALASGDLREVAAPAKAKKGKKDDTPATEAGAEAGA